MNKNILFYLLTFFIISGANAQSISSHILDNAMQYNPAEVSKHLDSYEVFQVDMSSISALQSRHNNQIESIDFHLKAAGFNTTLHLFNSGIVSSDYSRRTSSGTAIDSPIPSPMEGYTTEGQLVKLTINTHFLHGYIQTAETSYYIDNLSKYDPSAPDDLYVIYDIKGAEQVKNATCGTDAPQQASGTTQSQGPAYKIASTCWEIEYALAADYSMYLDYGSVSGVENHIMAIVNDMQTNYDNEFNDELSYSIVETYFIDCSGCDPWTTSTDAGTLLSDFRSWGNSGGFNSSYDVASLWTNRNFDGSTVGIAYLNALCSYSRYNCLSDFTSNMEYLREMNSHELGHNWGCGHDAQGSPYIMAPVVSSTDQWSSNSISIINSKIASSQGNGCLEACPSSNPPQAAFSADYTQVCKGSFVQFFEEAYGGQVTSYSWSFPGGTPSSSTEANPIVKYATPGSYDVSLQVTGPNGSTTENKVAYVQVGSGGVDVFEAFTFETGYDGWTTQDDGNNGSFTRTSVNGALGDQALFIDNYNAPSGTYDALISPTLNFAGRTQAFMQLDYAVAGNMSSNDSLIVYVSKDNGATYSRVFAITEDGTGNYVTAHTSGNFIPADSTDWCINHAGRGHNCLVIDLSLVAGYDDIKVKVQQYHESGNNLYIDKIAFRSDCYQLRAPEGAFTADITSGCAPLTVHFTDLSSQDPTSWQWTFPGGTPSSSTEENPTVVYENGGTYDVYLSVSNGAGSDNVEKIDFIVVNDVPITSFTYSRTGLVVSFVNTSSNAQAYHWDFGDGATSTDPNPVHTYAAPGQYTVTLTASNICGDNTYTETIEIVLEPVAGFSAQNTTICEGDPIQFNDESQYAENYKWIFEGGTPAISTESDPLVTYAQAGVYDVTQIVMNSEGIDTLIKDDYVVVLALPVADFTASANGLVVDFTDNSQYADSYLWDFGDGNTSTEQNPTHVYATGGTYAVQLIVENSCGSDTFTMQVNVLGAPNADFTSDVTEGCKALTVHFTSNSPTATSYLWTFEGGTPASSTLANPVVTYQNAGVYDVRLEVGNSSGSDIIVKDDYITANDLPLAQFTASTNGLIVTFNNTSTGADSYHWAFGDGETSTQKNPVHTYASSGQYTVTLTATNECGDATRTLTIGVGNFPNAQFEASDTEGCVPFQVSFENLYSGDVDSYAWTFEGGTPATSTDPNPTVTYDHTGVFDVQLIVTNGIGNDTLLKEDYIHAGTSPESDFAYNSNGLNVNFTEEVDGNYTNLQWEFGDGNTSTQENPTHNYADYGTYTVLLIAENACGEDTTAKTVQLIEPAEAAFDLSQRTGCVPFTVHFQNNSTGSNLTYSWIFEGGAPFNSTEKSPTVSYAAAGLYDVTLIVSNSVSSDTMFKEDYIEVLPDPIADFNFVLHGDTVVFNNLSQNALSYLWEFGDGETSTEENPTHIYDELNGNTVTLIAYNQCDTVSKTVVLDNSIPPEAAISAEAQKICVGTSVTYHDVSQGLVSSRTWTFEGGTPATSNEQNPTVVYNSTGKYNVSLIVENSAGSDTIEMVDFIYVIDVPVAQFDYEIYGDSVQFVQESIFADEYRWDFGNGIVQNGIEPAIIYENSGRYTVELIASNICGSDTINKVIDIITATKAIPQSAFQVYPNPFNDRLTIRFSDKMNGKVQLSIMDMQGHTVKQVEFILDSSRSRDLYTTDIAPGMYFLKLKNNGKIGYRKLIRQ